MKLKVVLRCLVLPVPKLPWTPSNIFHLEQKGLSRAKLPKRQRNRDSDKNTNYIPTEYQIANPNTKYPNTKILITSPISSNAASRL